MCASWCWIRTSTTPAKPCCMCRRIYPIRVRHNLPCAVPSDPIVAARVRAIDAECGNAFFQYQVPAAVITLKQGFGRLIRSLHDRGLLALLDNRILKKAYGRVFVESLPNYKKTTELRDVEEFFGGSRYPP